MKQYGLIVLVVLASCTSSERDSWQGTWNAKWETNPKAYGDMAEGMSFKMNGLFEFDGENVTVHAYGYQGCIFGRDTLKHTQYWEVRKDSLELQNQPGELGIHYTILEQTDTKIRLRLVDDIFIDLTR